MQVCGVVQDLDNAVMDKNYLKAAQLAFRLKQPGRLLGIVTTILADSATSAATAQATLARLIDGFTPEQIVAALRFICDWNATARHCHAAQALLHALLARTSPSVRPCCLCLAVSAPARR